MFDPILLAARWTDMWNRRLDVGDVISSDCQVHFGRQPIHDRPRTTVGVAQLQAVVDGTAERVPGVVFSFEGAPPHQRAIAGGRAGVITLLWEVNATGLEPRTGIDLLAHDGDRITTVWSITGDLRLPPLA